MKNLKNKLSYAIYIVLGVVFIGCTQQVPAEPIEKPFVITHKFPESARCNSNYCGYEYTDANGNVYPFCESIDAYNLGDTIK